MTFSAIVLQSAVFLPLLAAAIVLCFQSLLPRSLTNMLAAAGFFYPLLAALYLWMAFSGGPDTLAGFAFTNQVGDHLGYDLGLYQPFGFDLGIRMAFGLNGISMPLFVLAAVVGFAAGWQALRSESGERRNLFLGLILLMHAGLMGVFSSIDIFFFYFFHELALIPTFILIGIWGGPGRRTIALEVTIYLTLGAMLSLIGLIAIYASTIAPLGDFNWITLRSYLGQEPIAEVIQQNLTGLLLLGFGILVSLFPLHSWAPRAYAAAPTANAMLHAGVLKKFGLYGLIQVVAPLMPTGLSFWDTWLVWLALGNIVVIGFVTVAQRDLKQMVAFSSVMHMGYIFLGIAALTQVGAGAAVILMFAHGLSVALLFLLGQYVYDRTQTFDMLKMGGLGPKAPLLAGAFVLATFASIGLPGFPNFWGEFGVFVAIGETHFWALAPAALGIVLSAVYGLRSVARIFYGQPTEAFKARFETGGITDLSLSEKIPVVVLLLVMLLVGFWPKTVSDAVDAELAAQMDFPIVTLSEPVEDR